ncbi:MAG: flagellar protein FlgN, partial [Frankiales bacterium]|nr:flagellar protein FlgN [Frankiales bacterium]
MDALAALLTRERLLVELVVFKLVELRQLLLAGEARFLGWASEEVERAATAVRQTELERAVLVTGIATDRGLPADELTLSALVADAPEPWRSLLAESQTSLTASSAEVTALLATTRRLAEAGSRGLADTLRRL